MQSGGARLREGTREYDICQQSHQAALEGVCQKIRSLPMHVTYTRDPPILYIVSLSPTSEC